MIFQYLHKILALAAILSPLVGQGQIMPERTLVKDELMVRQARLEQNEAMAIGDIEAAVSFWTEDVTLRGGLGGSIIGKDAYRALLDPSPNENSIIYVRESDLVEVSSHWPLAYESGTWTARRGSKTGPILIAGRYSAQWIKRNEFWLIRSEVFAALTCTDLTNNWQALP